MSRRVKLSSLVAAAGLVGLIASACTRGGDDGSSGAPPPRVLGSTGALGPHLAVNFASTDDAGGGLLDDDAKNSPTSDLDSLPGGASILGKKPDEGPIPTHGATFSHASERLNYHDGGSDERPRQPLVE